MSEPLLPCPFCGNMQPHIESDNEIWCSTDDCEVHVWSNGSVKAKDIWNRRTPGPATKTMVAWSERFLTGTEPAPPLPETLQGFIAEWKGEPE